VPLTTNQEGGSSDRSLTPSTLALSQNCAGRSRLKNCPERSHAIACFDHCSSLLRLRWRRRAIVSARHLGALDDKPAGTFLAAVEVAMRDDAAQTRRPSTPSPVLVEVQAFGQKNGSGA